MLHSSEIQTYHDPNFDQSRQEGHDFVTHNLRLNPAHIGNFAIVGPDRIAEIAQRFSMPPSHRGGYDTRTNTAVILRNEADLNSYSGKIMAQGRVIHEIVHSATANPNEHLYYNEILAGIGEYKYLDWLQNKGEYLPASDFTLHRAGATLLLPRNWRYLDASEPNQKPADRRSARSSSGLIAALGLAHTLPSSSGITSGRILAASRPGGVAQFMLIKHSIDSVKQGLSKEVEKFDGSTEGIIQATAVIKAETEKVK